MSFLSGGGFAGYGCVAFVVVAVLGGGCKSVSVCECVRFGY